MAAMARKRIGQKYTKIANRIDILSANESGESRRMPGKNFSMKQLMKEKHKMYWENNFAVHTAPEKYGHLAPVSVLAPSKKINATNREVLYVENLTDLNVTPKMPQFLKMHW